MTVLVLGGASWVDRSSMLGTLDLLNDPTLCEKEYGPVLEIDLDARKSYEILKDALKQTKLLVVCGGKPNALAKCLKNQGKTVLRQWMTSSPSHKYLGICAGVAFAIQLGFNEIELVNDEVWRLSGIRADPIISFDTLLPGLEVETESSYHYESGPLIAFKKNLLVSSLMTPPSCCFSARFQSDVVSERLGMLKTISESSSFDSKSQWICQSCTFINSLSKGKCEFCSESRNYQLPPINEMPGTLAMVMFPKFLLSSVHPELSEPKEKESFRKVILFFLEEA
jgi:hypothetical protein